MALKDDALALASDLRLLAERAGEELLFSDEAAVAKHREDIHSSAMVLADRAQQIAEKIPTPESFHEEVAAAVADAVARGGLDPDPEDDDEEPDDDAVPHSKKGTKVGRRDMHGKPLRVGDRVQVYNSDRYGDPTGVVTGYGPDFGDGKTRVTVALDNRENMAYTPSCGRVERIQRFDGKKKRAKSAKAATGDGNGRQHNDVVLGILDLGPFKVGVLVPREVAEAVTE
jgi:hypothetical protein